ncbi:MAG: ParB/RepB/Spo0J family partition protein [Anaeroplasmataceae bacterium]
MENNRTSLKSLLEENDYSGSSNEEIIELPLSQIKPNPYQPRYVFNDASIDELAESIKEHGVFQPIIVKKMNKYYSIVSGERRYRACLKLGLETIPAIVRMYEKSKMIEIALIENLQRENLTPVEEAKAYRQMIREIGYNQEELGQKVGKSRSYITNMLGLLNLPDDILNLVDQGKISTGHARVLSKLSDINRIKELSLLIIEKGLSVRQIEELAKAEEKKAPLKKEKTASIYKEYEDNFKNKYKSSSIKVTNNKITISIKEEKELAKILDILCK